LFSLFTVKGKIINQKRVKLINIINMSVRVRAIEAKKKKKQATKDFDLS
jgi:hypothetical protein